MNRRALVGSLGALLLSAAAAVGVSRLLPRRHGGAADPSRLISLSPALTETVVELGSAARLVGVSDFCEQPAGIQLPRVGTSLVPSYEAIAALRPTLILSDGSAGSKTTALAELAPCEVLPWLTLAEVVQSVRRLGQVLDQQPAADVLASKLQSGLSRPAPAGAPRVLLLLSYDAARPRDIWFIKRNSLHGAALEAAGARNAVARDVPGLPKLSVEELVALDPDWVLIIPPPGASPALRRALTAAFVEAIPLRAGELGKVACIEGTLSVGPSILQLVAAVEQALVPAARRE